MVRSISYSAHDPGTSEASYVFDIGSEGCFFATSAAQKRTACNRICKLGDVRTDGVWKQVKQSTIPVQLDAYGNVI